MPKEATADERVTFRLQPENAKRLARFLSSNPTEVCSKVINRALAEWLLRHQKERTNGKDT